MSKYRQFKSRGERMLYIREYEHRYKHEDYLCMHSYTTTFPKDYYERECRDLIYSLYVDLFLNEKNGRRRKEYIKKIFRYWYGVPGYYWQRNKDFLKFNFTSPYPNYCNMEQRHYPDGSVGCSVKYVNFFQHNIKVFGKSKKKVALMLNHETEK